ncbi:MAG: hypothetical protein BGN88_05735 [Clostridiales bacterium 43-6]|nr:MAG: hypothetical protein BGN88_05735 [Clostridiales bacterium 43-6]
MNNEITGKMLNVIDFGAKGDNITDDTKAIEAALNKAAENKNGVFFPAGVYLCSDVKVPKNVGIYGVCNWGFRQAGGSVLKLNNENAVCLLNVTDALGLTINGMYLDGNKQTGSGIHGIYKNGQNVDKTEDAYRIERTKVEYFSGNGVHLKGAWCYTIRSSMIAHNRGHGIFSESCDGFIIDNWLTGNKGSGYHSDFWSCSTTMTGNRIEWNHYAGIFIYFGVHFNITGNYIDRSGGPGIYINKGESPDINGITITGNIIHRSGADEKYADTHEDSHMILHKVRGTTVVGNTFTSGRDDGGKTGRLSPSYGIVFDELEHTIIKDNTLRYGAGKELLLDLGNHRDGTIVKDNVGCIAQG